jgi:hypothetical protein
MRSFFLIPRASSRAVAGESPSLDLAATPPVQPCGAHAHASLAGSVPRTAGAGRAGQCARSRRPLVHRSLPLPGLARNWCSSQLTLRAKPVGPDQIPCGFQSNLAAGAGWCSDAKEKSAAPAGGALGGRRGQPLLGAWSGTGTRTGCTPTDGGALCVPSLAVDVEGDGRLDLPGGEVSTPPPSLYPHLSLSSHVTTSS